MPKAIWNGKIIAQAVDGEVQKVEGNIYFPPHSIDFSYLQARDAHTTCHWKGVASYYDIIVDGSINEKAAWSYPKPYDAARHIAGYIAFWQGVQIQD